MARQKSRTGRQGGRRTDIPTHAIHGNGDHDNILVVALTAPQQ
jgi:hypothetical protein